MPKPEQWASVADFPDYQVSDFGRVHSDLTDSILSPSLNSTGSLKVNLMRNNQVSTRSVRVLVATAFVADEYNVDDPTPINKDGDHWNNAAWNLAWRPRWFAWKYMRQFTEPVPPEYSAPVFDTVTGRQFVSTVQAGITDGILWEYIFQSILIGRPVYPTGGVFALAL